MWGTTAPSFKGIPDTCDAERIWTHPAVHKNALPPFEVLPSGVLGLAVVRGWQGDHGLALWFIQCLGCPCDALLESWPTFTAPSALRTSGTLV